MSVRFQVEGLDRIATALTRYPTVTKTFINQAIFAYANEVAKYARTRIRSGTRSGNVSMINGKPHVASAPDEYPARITKGRGKEGGLHGGIFWNRLSDGAEIISAAPYSAYLEDGTRNIKGQQTVGGVTFKGGRPFMAPSLKEKEEFFDDKINNALDKAEAEAFGGGAR